MNSVAIIGLTRYGGPPYLANHRQSPQQFREDLHRATVQHPDLYVPLQDRSGKDKATFRQKLRSLS